MDEARLARTASPADTTEPLQAFDGLDESYAQGVEGQRRGDWIRRIGYRIGGLPIALRAAVVAGNSDELRLRRIYAARFWQFRTAGEVLEIALASVLAPLVVLALIAWFAVRNGSTIARRAGRPIILQVTDQLRLYLSSGVLAPWYYIFELYRCPTVRHSREFAYRWESKGGVFDVLKEAARTPQSPLSDKLAFEDYCRQHDLPTPPVLAVVSNEALQMRSSDLLRDLFVKPVNGRGGKGAQRWVYLGGDLYLSGCNIILPLERLTERLRGRARSSVLLIQSSVSNHHELLPLNNGALSTIRILTCLDELDKPRIIAAAVRMAIGPNRTVDNLHCGGIAAAVDLATGTLGLASDLGADGSLGWLVHHPDSGARIAGKHLPMWDETCALALRAHRCFTDRVVVGWDIAITDDGPILIEGNGGPDLDIMQRFAGRGLMVEDFASMLVSHFEPRELAGE